MEKAVRISEHMRSIAVVTGTRAEYGLLQPVMAGIARDGGLKLQVIVTGMHLAPAFGHTVEEITADGFQPDAVVDMLLNSDTPAAMAKGVGIGIYGLAQAMETLRPDIVLVLGDRVEAFAAATAGSLSNLVVAHIHGGDRSMGGHDEAMRHAITKLAHIHLTASPAARERIIKMGERPECVFVVGAPGVDEVLLPAEPTAAELVQLPQIVWDQPLILVVQHPVSTRPETAAAEMTETLAAVAGIGLQAVVIYPNADAGGQAMIKVIEKYARLPLLHSVKNQPRRLYLYLLRSAAVLVGNSSSGVIEAPIFGTPVVNIGHRQEGREGVERCLQAAPDRQEITAAIRQALALPRSESNGQEASPYWQGGSAARIVSILRTIQLGPELRQKQIAY